MRTEEEGGGEERGWGGVRRGRGERVGCEGGEERGWSEKGTRREMG